MVAFSFHLCLLHSITLHRATAHPTLLHTQEYDYHIPVPELTGADINAPIVTLNMPLIGVVENIHAAFGPAYQRLLDLLVSIIAGWVLLAGGGRECCWC